MASFDIIQVLQTVSLVGLYLWMVLYGLLFFLPFLPPYEIVLLTIGYAMSVGNLGVLFVYVVIVLAALTVNSIFFSLTKHGSPYIKRYIEKYGKKTITKYKPKLDNNYFKTFLVLDFVPKIRLFTCVISGTLDVRWRKFLSASLFANSIVAAFYIFLGYFFHQTIQNILVKLRAWQHLLFYVVMLAVVALLFFGGRWVYKKYQAKRV